MDLYGHSRGWGWTLGLWRTDRRFPRVRYNNLRRAEWGRWWGEHGQDGLWKKNVQSRVIAVGGKREMPIRHYPRCILHDKSTINKIQYNKFPSVTSSSHNPPPAWCLAEIIREVL